ncbi:YetF domain-containing protein [Weizmannia acidilactici]|uniref:YetF domain-containing protein n=1 Tax=Weizmannia acidilactici TaxID=2607726 RepID=UPI00266D0C67|nr:YetF domain-containing protein [Weizmannia acidilactici]
MDPKYQSLTPNSSLESGVFNLPRILIKEGKINFKELEEIHKDKRWLITSLESLYQTEVKMFCSPHMIRKIN